MVMLNVATDLDLANGTRGVIVDIVLDPREDQPCAGAVSRLHYPPALVLFKPLNPPTVTFPSLDNSLIPIFPCEKKFTIKDVDGKNKTITRRQLPVTPGFAYTDIRSQGQTMEYVVVDIGRTPNFSLSPFNAYVALSWSRGRDTIRLLRDFDSKLFTNHPSDDLRAEDDRLMQLDAETRAQFEKGMI